MIINADLNFIFVHVPKTAGQAITRSLPRNKRLKIETHCPLHLVDKGDKYAFGFVRNPWERMVSLYCFRTQNPRPGIFDAERLKREGFEYSVLNNTISRQNDTNNFNYYNHRDAMWWLDGCDFIGRVETLQDDFAIVCDKIGIHRRTVKTLNQSRHGDYRKYHTTKTIEHVAKEHAETIEKFGYSFEDNHSI